MSGGYTPVFGRQLFSGSLCGKYPDTAAWVFLLALADKYGKVDLTPQYISMVTGMPVVDLLACIERFCSPDPDSRTSDHDGRRLEKLDPDRPWGWRVLNFVLYRERARKKEWDDDRTVSGRDAARKRDQRVSSRPVPTSPGESLPSPLSDSDSDSDTNTDAGEEAPVGGRTPNREEKIPAGRAPIDEIVELYNKHCTKLRRVKVLTDARRQAIQGRWEENEDRQTLAWWTKYFCYINECCPFLAGDNDRDWRADFDFITKPDNLVKIIESCYTGRKRER